MIGLRSHGSWCFTFLVFFFYISLIHNSLMLIQKSKWFLQVFLKKSPRWLLTSLLTFETFVLEFRYHNYFKFSSSDSLLCLVFETIFFFSFYENRYGRGLKFRKIEGRLDCSLTWPVQLNRLRHRLLPLDR